MFAFNLNDEAFLGPHHTIHYQQYGGQHQHHYGDNDDPKLGRFLVTTVASIRIATVCRTLDEVFIRDLGKRHWLVQTLACLLAKDVHPIESEQIEIALPHKRFLHLPIRWL